MEKHENVQEGFLVWEQGARKQMSLCVGVALCVCTFGNGKKNPQERGSQETALIQKRNI